MALLKLDSIENDTKKKLFKEIGKKVEKSSSKDSHHAWAIDILEQTLEIAKKNEETFKKEIDALMLSKVGVKMDENDYKHPVGSMEKES